MGYLSQYFFIMVSIYHWSQTRVGQQPRIIENDAYASFEIHFWCISSKLSLSYVRRSHCVARRYDASYSPAYLVLLGFRPKSGSERDVVHGSVIRLNRPSAVLRSLVLVVQGHNHHLM